MHSTNHVAMPLVSMVKLHLCALALACVPFADEQAVLLQVPAWPFVTASFAFGYFALGPFFALWTPVADEQHKQTGPPRKSDLVST